MPPNVEEMLITPEMRQLAENVRSLCLQAALAAYEDAGIQGLCAEGRWECAVSAIQVVDLQAIIATVVSATTQPPELLL